MKKQVILLAILLASVALITSCDKPEDPEIPNEEELITTLKMTLVAEGGGSPIEFSFQDSDGDGGNAPVISNGRLASNTSYSATLELLNELENPAEDITEEVEEEGEEHQFFFKSTVDGLSVEYNDMDANGSPIGLSTIVTTADAASGTLSITLRHEPAKDASGVADGDITNAGGETDIELTFNVEVE